MLPHVPPDMKYRPIIGAQPHKCQAPLLRESRVWRNRPIGRNSAGIPPLPHCPGHLFAGLKKISDGHQVRRGERALASISTVQAQAPSGQPLGVNVNEAEFTQYRMPVGSGPSSKTCPRWAQHRLSAWRPGGRSCTARIAQAGPACGGGIQAGRCEVLAGGLLALGRSSDPPPTQVGPIVRILPGYFVSTNVVT